MTDAPEADTFPHRTPKGPRKSHDPDAPAHYRLSSDTWEMILKEYREGATAPFLARKWRVSEHALRRRITRHKATKREWGDAQAIGQAVAREAELDEARRNSPEAVAARLFDGIEGIEVALSGDLEALAKLAAVTSGRAMTGRLWSEARALAGLAESYARLGERAAGGRGGGGSIATIDLGLLLEIIVDPDGAVTKRFERKDEGANDPDAALKAHYWDYQAARHRAVGNNTRELMMRAVYAEKRLGELGHPARVNVTDVEIEAWVRDWLSAPPSEANLDRRTKLGEWPWR